MLGWAVGFFVAALVAAIFGFGGIASAFSGIAVLLFWVFVALLVLSLVVGLFRGGSHADGSPALGGGGTFATIALVAGVAILTYAWMKNDMSAEKLGRNVDHTVSQVAENTSDALHDAGNKAEDVTQDVRNDIDRTADRNSDNH